MGYFYSDEYLEHHGIKGQKWGVRRFQNPDGSLTPRGKRRFSKLIELNKEHEADVKKATAAANKEYRYMRSKGLGKDEGYKDEARELYAIDEKFKKIWDEHHNAWMKSVESGKRLIKEELKVERSNFNILTVMGAERTKQILEDYKDWEIAETKQKAEAKKWNDSKSYNKDFLNYIKKDVVKPEMVDDPELMDLMVMEYEADTGKKAMK